MNLGHSFKPKWEDLRKIVETESWLGNIRHHSALRASSEIILFFYGKTWEKKKILENFFRII